MKFPKSMHPEGWLEHIDRDAAPAASRPAGTPLKPRTPRPSAKIRATDPLRVEPLHATAATMPPRAVPGGTPAATQRAGSSSTPWIIGTIAGAALIGGAALTMSRQTAGPGAPAMPPVLLGEVTPPAAPASSAEDSLLAQAPTAAGADAPAPAEPQATLVASPPPAPKAPAPAPKLAEAPKAEAPAPVVRSLTPPPETLAEASPPLALLREPAPAAEPTTPQPAEPVVTPSVAEPVLARATPPAADPADAGITVKVREALASDATLAAVPIAVSTDQGVVKLEGQAPDVQARERATVVAAATTGVRGVDNRLTLPSVTVGALQGHGS